jgi:uncharacterized protein (TIGR03000 family)
LRLALLILPGKAVRLLLHDYRGAAVRTRPYTGLIPKHPNHLPVKEFIMRSFLSSVLFGLSVLGLSALRLSAAPPNSAPATVRVSLPADAALTIDGHATKSTSAVRHFVSPPLESDKTFYYTFQAKFVRAGKTISVQQKVPVRAGRETVVSLEVPQEAGTLVPGSNRYTYSEASSDTGAYYEAPVPGSSAPVPPQPFPFWGNNPSDPFYHGSEW